jgi:hypothetical protein
MLFWARSVMPQDGESFDLADGGRTGFVPAVFARSLEEAEKYRELLDDHDIPAIVGSDQDDEEGVEKKLRGRGMTRGVPVLVPEVLLDEASEVIADREEVDEFETAEDDLAEDEDDEDDEFELTEELDLENEEQFEDDDELLEDEVDEDPDENESDDEEF